MVTRKTSGASATKSGIERKPGVMGGSPVIAGTRIRVADIVRYRELYKDEPLSRIVQSLPHITVAQINAAIDFYNAHRDEIDRYIEAEDRLADELRSSPRST